MRNGVLHVMAMSRPRKEVPNRVRRADTLTWTVRTIAMLLLVLVLQAVGAGPAVAEDFEPPKVVPSVQKTGSLPGMIIVRWEHAASSCGLASGPGCVWNYWVERENPYRIWPTVNADQRDLPDGGLEPDKEYRYKVCARFATEDGDVACSEPEWVAGRTSPPEAPRQPERPTQPRIVEHHSGQTWIGIKWDAGYDYDSYFINITGPFGTAKGPRELRTVKHGDDGTWGYQRIDGLLPGRVYDFSVQGCTETVFGLFGDHCHQWSPVRRASTLAYPQDSGPDTCAPPFVWREAFKDDHVCVESSRRKQVAADNAQAQSPARREFCTPPNCTFTGPVTCKVGYVWREARPGDQVCVTPKERSQVAAENALANQRRAVPPR